MILISQSSFAITVKQAKERTFEGIINTNNTRIIIAADNGYCSTDMYMNSKKIEDYYKNLGFEIINGTDNVGEIISWCD